VDWIQLLQDRMQWWGLVNNVGLMKLRVPLRAGHFLTSSTTISLSRSTLAIELHNYKDDDSSLLTC
jgi:hypothetical protein